MIVTKCALGMTCDECADADSVVEVDTEWSCDTTYLCEACARRLAADLVKEIGP